jgi:hypothetical protein
LWVCGWFLRSLQQKQKLILSSIIIYNGTQKSIDAAARQDIILQRTILQTIKSKNDAANKMAIELNTHGAEDDDEGRGNTC